MIMIIKINNLEEALPVRLSRGILISEVNQLNSTLMAKEHSSTRTLVQNWTWSRRRCQQLRDLS